MSCVTWIKSHISKVNLSEVWQCSQQAMPSKEAWSNAGPELQTVGQRLTPRVCWPLAQLRLIFLVQLSVIHFWHLQKTLGIRINVILYWWVVKITMITETNICLKFNKESILLVQHNFPIENGYLEEKNIRIYGNQTIVLKGSKLPCKAVSAYFTSGFAEKNRRPSSRKKKTVWMTTVHPARTTLLCKVRRPWTYTKSLRLVISTWDWGSWAGSTLKLLWANVSCSRGHCTIISNNTAL